jgi:hypothetical protein
MHLCGGEQRQLRSVIHLKLPLCRALPADAHEWPHRLGAVPGQHRQVPILLWLQSPTPGTIHQGLQTWVERSRQAEDCC